MYSPFLESGLWFWGSLGLRIFLEGLEIVVDIVLEEQSVPSHKQSVCRNFFTRVGALL